MSELTEIKQLLERIDGRLERLEDLEAIRRLIVDYARGADHGNDPAMLTPLFTEDAVWEAKGFGRWEGRDKAIGFLKAIAGEKVWWSLHFMISPKIDLAPDGKSAKLIWYLWEPATMPDEETKVPEPHWITGVYDAEVVKTERGWLFKRITSGMNMISPAKDGWVKMRFPKGSKTMPYLTQLEPGTYFWCACGRSAKQPYCDGSHKGSEFSPMKFEIREFDLVGLCGCKKTKTPPYCDASHLGLQI
jgi:CDGSH-type Zn-finger protein